MQSKTSSSQLNYVQACNKWIEGYSDPTFILIAVHNHKISKDACLDPKQRKIIYDQHLRLLTEMEDGNWIWLQADAVQLQSPRVIGQYVIDRKLFTHPEFSWVKKHFNWDQRKVKALRVFAVQSKRDQRFKFGIQVPSSPKNALELD